MDYNLIERLLLLRGPGIPVGRSITYLDDQKDSPSIYV